MTQGPADVDDLGYEQARDELVDIVRRLEAGAATLEESLQLWERGQALAARCEQWLAGARARVDALTLPHGTPAPTVPIDTAAAGDDPDA
ncbi:MAG TPA: exodeoxyribonuclease VII small subunit [Kineosporiaceae bacterium]|nr:exodeoxyribonuclease VII small subunit [Kineosporiaceae bacterium]